MLDQLGQCLPFPHREGHREAGKVFLVRLAVLGSLSQFLHHWFKSRMGTHTVARDTAPNPIATEPLRLLGRKSKDRRRWARNRAN